MTLPPANSPFHEGEQDIQQRLGVRDQIEGVGQRFIRDHLPDQHREFYEQLPMVLIGSVDKTGQPWASLLTGSPGFMRSPDGAGCSSQSRPLNRKR